jgi:glycosyltransferase involved in cell wall biosynthesis
MSSGSQRYSLFHGGAGAEAGLRTWHAPYAELFAGRERVLDLGCGPGYFLDLLRERGVTGIGIDLDPAMVDAARARGHDARTGSHADLGTFRELGGVHLSHVIEHLWGDDAIALLEASFAALGTGGILVVRTPNWGNATVRHGGFWLDHTHKRPYPLELLTKVLGDIGFELVQAGHEPGGWEDTFVVARKPVRARSRLRWHGRFLGAGAASRANRLLARALIARGGIDLVPAGEPTPALEAALGLTARRLESVDDGLPLVEAGYAPQPDFGGDLWCPSNDERRAYVAAGTVSERVHVVPYGVDPTIYRPDGPAFDHGLSVDGVFLYAGSLRQTAGLAKVLEAYTQAFAGGERVALLVRSDPASPPGILTELRALAARTDVPPIRLVEIGSDEEAARFYRSGNALVAPLDDDGFGLPLLEAMACGLAVVAGAGGPSAAFVDETVGYVVGPSTPALVAALRRVLLHRDEAAERGRAGAARAHAEWSWERAADRAAARIEARAVAPGAFAVGSPAALNAFEAKYSSQNGEDGMLHELFARLRVVDPFFVEFGVETGLECNSAFFARQLGWHGLMMEGDPTLHATLRDNYRALPGVRTVQAMVTRENIAALFAEAGVPGDFDLLSIDVDGNDYHLWSALGAYRPRVVVIEINGAYPPPQRWVMAYDPAHRWRHDDYYGASLTSYAALGNRLGYALLATDRNGVNAIFVRRELLGIVGFPERTPAAAYHPPAFRFPHRAGPAHDEES